MRVQFTERGIIALCCLASFTTLIATGKDSWLCFAQIAVVAGYFGLDVVLDRINITKRRGK